jgi:hypothetical protein
MNLKALRAGSHCVGDELCRGGDTAAGGESCRTGFYFRKKEKHMDTIAAYLIFLNLVGFLIMGEDKRRAKMHRWRISERMLFLVSILGGSIGTWAGICVPPQDETLVFCYGNAADPHFTDRRCHLALSSGLISFIII